MIPTNAQKIVDVRATGFKPAELVLISMIGRINEPNHTVYAGAGRDYDWSWLRGVQACLFVTSGIEWRKAAMSILAAKPEYFALWDAGRSQGAELWTAPHVDDIDKPKNQWRLALDYMPWTPEQNWRFHAANS